MAAAKPDLDSMPTAMRESRETVRVAVGDIAPIDGLRGLAVLWVILFHMYVLERGRADPWLGALAASPYLEPLMGAGYLGVDLFFLISGFLLALPWFARAADGKAPPETRAFYARRLRRIVPAYYVQLAVLFVAVLPLLRGFDYWRSDLYIYLYNAFAHAAFLQGTTPLTSGSMEVNGALWTLAVEAQFYFLLPLVVPLFLRWPYRCLAVAFVMALAWRFSAQDALGALVDAELALGARWHWSEASVRDMLLHQAPSYLGHFALGIVLGREWLRRRADARAWAARVHLDALLVVAMALFYWVLAIDGRLLGDFTWMLAPLCLGLALFRAALARGSLADRLLARGPLAFMGRISYSAYLYHLPLLLVWHRLAGAMPRALFLPTYLAAVIAVSWLSWRFIERPFLRSDGRRAGV